MNRTEVSPRLNTYSDFSLLSSFQQSKGSKPREGLRRQPFAFPTQAKSKNELFYQCQKVSRSTRNLAGSPPFETCFTESEQVLDLRPRLQLENMTRNSTNTGPDLFQPLRNPFAKPTTQPKHGPQLSGLPKINFEMIKLSKDLENTNVTNDLVSLNEAIIQVSGGPKEIEDFESNETTWSLQALLNEDTQEMSQQVTYQEFQAGMLNAVWDEHLLGGLKSPASEIIYQSEPEQTFEDQNFLTSLIWKLTQRRIKLWLPTFSVSNPYNTPRWVAIITETLRSRINSNHPTCAKWLRKKLVQCQGNFSAGQRLPKENLKVIEGSAPLIEWNDWNLPRDPSGIA